MRKQMYTCYIVYPVGFEGWAKEEMAEEFDCEATDMDDARTQAEAFALTDCKPGWDRIEVGNYVGVYITRL